jgi:hypothetical protein
MRARPNLTERSLRVMFTRVLAATRVYTFCLCEFFNLFLERPNQTSFHGLPFGLTNIQRSLGPFMLAVFDSSI